MGCEWTIERLPWWLNGSLDPAEREAVRGHLEHCAACRRELGETADAGRLYDTHPATETLVAMAFGDPERETGEALEHHLERCPSCRAELELAAASASMEEATDEPLPAFASRRPGRRLAAAAVVGAALLGSAVFVWQQSLETERLTSQLAATRGRLAELRERWADADAPPGGRGIGVPAPRADHPVLELLPDDLVLRSPEAPDAGARIPEGASWVTVLLSAPGASERDSYRIELREEGETLWRSEPTAPDELGSFTLLLPADELRAAGRTLVVLPAEDSASAAPILRYRLD